MSDVNGETGGSGGPGGSARPGGATGLSRPGGGPVAGRRLERKVDGRILAGVCAGLADYFNLDPVLVRVIFVVFTFFGGFGLVAYFVAWALVPEEGEATSIADKFINKTGS